MSVFRIKLQLSLKFQRQKHFQKSSESENKLPETGSSSWGQRSLIGWRRICFLLVAFEHILKLLVQEEPVAAPAAIKRMSLTSGWRGGEQGHGGDGVQDDVIKLSLHDCDSNRFESSSKGLNVSVLGFVFEPDRIYANLTKTSVI